MKVITFSRFFTAYHPRKGEPTYFVEKILKGFFTDAHGWATDEISLVVRKYTDVMGAIHNPNHYAAKGHTIRGGNRWKVGDKASLRVWSGKPYASKQVEFLQVEIKKIWNIRIEGNFIWINRENFYNTNRLAQNDGLSELDFWNWFPQKRGKVFDGQIICWNESIEY